MYEKKFNEKGYLIHSSECKFQYGRKDYSCPKCCEMLSGESFKRGWSKNYHEFKKIQEEILAKAISEHDCSRTNCRTKCMYSEI